MEREEREALARRVLATASADETEVLVFDTDSALTRFTHNAIHQNVAAADTVVQVRAIVDRRVGVARTNDLREASLLRTAALARELAAFAPRDEELPPLPDRASYEAPAQAFSQTTAGAPPQTRAAVAADVFAVMERDGLWSAGYVTTARGGITVANSRGVLASFDGTDAAINVKANASDSTGYAEFAGTDAAMLDGEAIATIAAQKAVASRSPRSVDAGTWTVILEPAAFGELFSYLAPHFSAQAFDEGSSFLSDGLDRTYMGENVTVRDDYAQPLTPGMPFDYEGAPKTRPTLIERGVAKNVVTDAYWARKLGRPNTGHALPAPNAHGPQPLNIVVDPGAKDVAQLIAETERGLLVTRFWYIRPVDQRRTIVTGMTRDGLFLIENGKLTHGVRNLRFNQSIVDALRTCEPARELRRTGGYAYSITVPAVKLERFTFSSGTDF